MEFPINARDLNSPRRIARAIQKDIAIPTLQNIATGTNNNINFNINISVSSGKAKRKNSQKRDDRIKRNSNQKIANYTVDNTSVLSPTLIHKNQP